MQAIMLSSTVKSNRRSGCPVSVSLEMLGDRWSLLIVRDLMVRGFRTFKEFQTSGEGIATNILADRLRKLESAGIITAETGEQDGRRVNYRLTEKGIDLAPVLLELLVWGARHQTTHAPAPFLAQVQKNRDAFLAEVRRRWADRDPTPVLPTFRRESIPALTSGAITPGVSQGINIDLKHSHPSIKRRTNNEQRTSTRRNP
jgi:DNA-binding HxlR family transcriptional regulator